MRHDGELLIRRSLSLAARDEGTVVGWVEDNFHHLGVTVRHDGVTVRAVSAATVRIPWTTCCEAGTPLEALVGQPLLRRASLLARRVPMQFQCTHLFELAALAMVHASARRADRRYDIVVRRDPTRAEEMTGTLAENGEVVLAWTVVEGRIAGPREYAGQSLFEGFRDWLEALSDEEAGHVWMLRRGFWLAAGLSAFQPRAVAAETGLGHVCYSYQPAQRDRAYAIGNSQLDMRDPNVLLLSRKDETP